MKLVIDTSVVFSLFKTESFTRELLSKYKLELYAPKELINELEKYADIISSKANISKDKFLDDLFLLNEIIKLKDASLTYKKEAEKLISDKSDLPFLALALELNCSLWSLDSHFKEQSKIKVYNTKELSEELLKLNQN